MFDADTLPKLKCPYFLAYNTIDSRPHSLLINSTNGPPSTSHYLHNTSVLLPHTIYTIPQSLFFTHVLLTKLTTGGLSEDGIKPQIWYTFILATSINEEVFSLFMLSCFLDTSCCLTKCGKNFNVHTRRCTSKAISHVLILYFYFPYLVVAGMGRKLRMQQVKASMLLDMPLGQRGLLWRFEKLLTQKALSTQPL